MAVRRSFPTRSASSRICRRRSLPLSAPRSRRCAPRTSSSMCATFRTPTAMRRALTSTRSWPRSEFADRADRVIEVWNKLDCLDADARSALAGEERTNAAAPLAISATTGEGIDRLLQAIEDRLARGRSLRRTDARRRRRAGPSLALRTRRGHEPPRRRSGSASDGARCGRSDRAGQETLRLRRRRRARE